MGRTNTTEQMITAMAKKYPQMRFVDSSIKGLYYAVAPEDDRLAILCGGGVSLFSIDQLRTMTKEAVDVWECIIDESCKRSRKTPCNSLR